MLAGNLERDKIFSTSSDVLQREPVQPLHVEAGEMDANDPKTIILGGTSLVVFAFGMLRIIIWEMVELRRFIRRALAEEPTEIVDRHSSMVPPQHAEDNSPPNFR